MCDEFDSALRCQGENFTPVPVPEPASLTLLGSGARGRAIPSAQAIEADCYARRNLRFVPSDHSRRLVLTRANVASGPGARTES